MRPQLTLVSTQRTNQWANSLCVIYSGSVTMRDFLMMFANGSVIFTIAKSFEQRTCITFCVNIGRSITATNETIRHAFDEHSLRGTKDLEWCASFDPWSRAGLS